MALPSVDDSDIHASPVVKAGRYDPLAKWLWDLQIDIPDQHFKESIFSLSILNMVCTNFAVEDINSTYIPSEQADGNTAEENPAMDLNVAGITASCSGKYKSTGMSGKVSATIASSQPQALGMRLDFTTEQHNTTTTNTPNFSMATAISMNDCQVHLKVSKLHLSGSISAKIINLFQKEIRGYVSDALAKQLCPALKGTMDDAFTKLIQQADKYMLGLIPDDEEDEVEQDLGMLPAAAALTQRRRMGGLLSSTNLLASIDWKWNQDAPLVVTILHLVNMFLDRYLDQGFFVDAMKLIGLLDDELLEHDCGYFYRGVNGLMHTLTGGRIEFSIPESLEALRNITFEIPHYASISIMTKMVSIAGIDQLDRLTLLQPSDGDSFWTQLQATKGLNLTAALDIQVAAIPGGAFSGDPLLESFHLSINTTSLDVSGNLTLDVNRTRFEKTTLNHMINGINDNQADVACCLYPIEKFGVEELLATVGMQSISIVPNEHTADSNALLGGSLERDIDGMINSFLSLFLTEYHTFVTLAFSGLLNGPAKDAAEKAGNSWLNNLVHELKANDTSCEASGIINASTAIAADYLNFSNTKILDKFNHFLNNTQTLGDANKYLECISNVVQAQVEAKTPTLEYAGASLQLQRMVVKDADSLESIGKFLNPFVKQHWLHLTNPPLCRALVARGGWVSSFEQSRVWNLYWYQHEYARRFITLQAPPRRGYHVYLRGINELDWHCQSNWQCRVVS
jgi:hypothetical protein